MRLTLLDWLGDVVRRRSRVARADGVVHQSRHRTARDTQHRHRRRVIELVKKMSVNLLLLAAWPSEDEITDALRAAAAARNKREA